MHESSRAVFHRCYWWLCASLYGILLLFSPVAAQQHDPADLPADSAAATHSVAAETQVSDTLTVGERRLKAVARALVAVDSVRRAFHERQGALDDSLKAGGDLHAEFKAAVARVIEAEGIGLEFYTRVVRAARRDPELRGRLVSAVAEVRGP